MIEIIQSLFIIAVAVFVVALAFHFRDVRRATRFREEAEKLGQVSAEALAKSVERLVRSSDKLQHRITIPEARRFWSHPSPAPDQSPYDTEGPYGGVGNPPPDSSTSYFYRLRARGFNAMEAALIARGFGPIHFGDEYPPKKMLEVGMSWVKETAQPKGRLSGRSTWEERFAVKITGRYIHTNSGWVIQESVSEEEKKALTDKERETWVHDAMRLLYPSWALEGVIPPMKAPNDSYDHSSLSKRSS